MSQTSYSFWIQQLVCTLYAAGGWVSINIHICGAQPSGGTLLLTTCICMVFLCGVWVCVCVCVGRTWWKMRRWAHDQRRQTISFSTRFSALPLCTLGELALYIYDQNPPNSVLFDLLPANCVRATHFKQSSYRPHRDVEGYRALYFWLIALYVSRAFR